MLLDPAPIEKLFQSMGKTLDAARNNLGRGLTIVEKILYSHMDPDTDYSKLERVKSDIFLNCDRTYFLAMDRDVETLSRYVDFATPNMATFSLEMARVLLAAGSEADRHSEGDL